MMTVHIDLKQNVIWMAEKSIHWLVLVLTIETPDTYTSSFSILTKPIKGKVINHKQISNIFIILERERERVYRVLHLRVINKMSNVKATTNDSK